ncbi:phenylalanine--tRNA ligase subunit alpha, partial [Candidatus Peregrinibacteria bacterium CG10_big_fil_rev_8_21_14_0_10_36_19]
MVLRTHTSPVQIRSMEKYGAPLRLIIPGRVFRYEATDASHDTTFYQVEGLLIEENASLSHLKGVMAEFLTRLFGKPVKVRFRPGYFPFVEPGLELDFSCLLCEEKGCRVCKNTGWIEFMGAGMVHENVLKAGGIDPQKYQGWAFGFGLTRLVMMRYGITDIRLLTNGDLRFVKQF